MQCSKKKRLKCRALLQPMRDAPKTNSICVLAGAVQCSKKKRLKCRALLQPMRDAPKTNSICVLVNLNGYAGTAKSADLFALRPAPVAVSYMGFPGTMGSLEMVDYILADGVVIPAEKRSFYSEKVLFFLLCLRCMVFRGGGGDLCPAPCARHSFSNRVWGRAQWRIDHNRRRYILWSIFPAAACAPLPLKPILPGYTPRWCLSCACM